MRVKNGIDIPTGREVDKEYWLDRLIEVEKASNNEIKHIEEDSLLRDFIRYVAESGTELAEEAKVVASAEAIPYRRWYA